jgi:hypothetical protein
MAWLRDIVRMPRIPSAAALPVMTGEELEISERLRTHVNVLAGKIGERNVFRFESLRHAAHYIEEQFRGKQWSVVRQEFDVDGTPVWNIEAERRGATLPDEVVLVGAHYDSVVGSPGANDNASGVAAILELARLLDRHKHARSIRLVAFVNEEPPFFQTPQMGSAVYAHRARQNAENICAMLSVETIGYYSDERGSQRYPFPFGLLYPDRGNFIGVVGNTASRGLVRQCMDSFRRHTRFPVEGLAAPGWVMGVGWSDHWAFWKEGYQAAMMTDTALFRYPAYHSPYDTPEKLDYCSTALVVATLGHVVLDFAASA